MTTIQRYKILYFITVPDRGGAQSHVLDLLSGFREQYELHLAVGSEGPLTKSARELGVPTYILSNLQRSVSVVPDLCAMLECHKLIRLLRPDLVHAHSSKAGIVARIAAQSLGVPSIFTAHGWAFTPGTPRVRRLIGLLSERLIAPLSSSIICVSEFDREMALRYKVGQLHQITTIRYGLPNILVSQANPAQHPPKLVMVARFNEQKDQITLLQALSRSNLENIHLDLIGDGPDIDRIKRMSIDIGISGRVSFLGNRADVQGMLSEYQIFVLSTHYEGLPISILEAMRAGLPVIATRVNGIPEEVINNGNGLLVPHRDVSALATALIRLIDTPELRQRMGMAGRSRFLSNFTLERMLREIESVYNGVLER